MQRTYRLNGGTELERPDATAREERCKIEVIVWRYDGDVCSAAVSTARRAVLLRPEFDPNLTGVKAGSNRGQVDGG